MKLNIPSKQTLHDASARIRAGKLKSIDAVEACLAQIDSLEPEVRAWVSLDREGARVTAQERDREIAAGRWRGPLHGIPLGIKDIFDIAGLPTAAGSRLLAREPKSRDATVITRLRDAGAVILGKTVTTQYASFDPPVTRNPWNTACTPAGSSSGSAAAVATGMCLGALGSQTGGSITRPAAYCGVSGCKPTFGRVSLKGVFPLAPSMDHAGPIAPTVRDLAILLDAISGTDPEDPHCLDAPPTRLYEELQTRSETAPKLGRIRGMFDGLAEPSVLSATDHALERLSRAGATVANAQLPSSFDNVVWDHRTVMAVEVAAYHEPRVVATPEDYLPCIRALYEEGMAVTAREYARCRQHQTQLSYEMAQAFEGVDVLVCPSTTSPAPDAATTGNPAFNSPWSYTGLPTITLPIGLDPTGLPLGLQLVGRRWDESRLFAAALWCEEHLWEG